MSVFMSVPCRFHYNSFVASFETRKYESSKFAILFQVCLAVGDTLYSVYILGWIPALSTCHWDFDRGCTNL